jgi:hypothetical protein
MAADFARILERAFSVRKRRAAAPAIVAVAGGPRVPAGIADGAAGIRLPP